MLAELTKANCGMKFGQFLRGDARPAETELKKGDLGSSQTGRATSRLKKQDARGRGHGSGDLEK